MPQLTLDLRVLDVDGNLVVDPVVFVRLATPDNQRSTSRRTALRGEPSRQAFEDGPPGPALFLRVTPSRYRDGGVTCSVDGDGLVTPTDEVRLPRRPSEWNPGFTPWRLLPEPFGLLQDVLSQSPVFRVGRTSNPELFIAERYDAVDPADESRTLAKLCLLNLYARLRDELTPDLGQPWFERVGELLLATRERFIAEVDEACWEKVRDLAENPRDGYRKTPVGDHKKNFEAIPGVEAVTDLASVKTRDEKANLQFTVARAVRNGNEAFLLDTDMDENGKLLLHTFDLIKHFFNGGTHPIDIHECLRAGFPTVALGYQLEPRLPVADTTARMITAAVSPALVPASDAALLETPREIAVLGDSVPWGQGLLNAQKMHMLVAEAVSSGGAFPAVRLVAHSGATVGVGTARQRQPVDGEVPKAHPTILQQVADYPAEEAASVDLVIVNGGMNDVDFRFILNPFTAPDDLEDTTVRACGPDLQVLLRAVASRFPAARVAVLEYYRILSPESRFSWGLEFLTAAGAPAPAALMANPTGAFPSIWDRIIDNCRVFHVASAQAIRAAVAATNRELSTDRFIAIDPGFRDENAALAPRAWLWGVNWDLSPQDPVAIQRRQACNLFESDPILREQCFRASVGHPNALGAHAYASAVVAALMAVPA